MDAAYVLSPFDANSHIGRLELWSVSSEVARASDAWKSNWFCAVSNKDINTVSAKKIHALIISKLKSSTSCRQLANDAGSTFSYNEMALG